MPRYTSPTRDIECTEDNLIILRTFPFKETDVIVRALTQTAGKCAFIAKSAKKSTSRFSAGLDTFDVGHALYIEKAKMHVLESFSPLKHFHTIRFEPCCVVTASLLTEATDLLSHDHDPAGSDLYEPLSDGLEALATIAANTTDINQELTPLERKNILTKDSLSVAFLALGALLMRAGFQHRERSFVEPVAETSDNNEVPAATSRASRGSARELFALITTLESACNKQLTSRTALEDLVRSLKS